VALSFKIFNFAYFKFNQTAVTELLFSTKGRAHNCTLLFLEFLSPPADKKEALKELAESYGYPEFDPSEITEDETLYRKVLASDRRRKDLANAGAGAGAPFGDEATAGVGKKRRPNRASAAAKSKIAASKRRKLDGIRASVDNYIVNLGRKGGLALLFASQVEKEAKRHAKPPHSPISLVHK
jgi:hypothetical protein